jgi:hypothetical protein
MNADRNTSYPFAILLLIFLGSAWLLAGFFILARLTLIDVGAPLLPEESRMASWALVILIALLPAATSLLAGLGFRRFRNVKVRTTKTAERPETRLQETPPSDPQQTLNLEEALGAAHLSELRDQVDLLCAMAAGERISRHLLEDLKCRGFAEMAHQAAVSAEVVRRILADPRLADQLERSGIEMPPQSAGRLGADLHAITTALAWLGKCIDPGALFTAPLRMDVSHREQLTAAMDPVDQLLVQSTLLLAGISDLARVLAECYMRQWGPEPRHVSGKMPQKGGAQETPELSDGVEYFPNWKLN